MNLNRKAKPIRFEGEVKDTSVCIQTNMPLDDPNAELVCAGQDRGCDLRIERSTGCETVVMLHEELALEGAGQYEIVLYDGCDECGRLPVVITDNCYITGTETKTATKRKACNEC